MNNLKTYISKNGGLKSFAEVLGVRYQSVQAWLEKGYVPAARVKDVSKLTKISAKDLNPKVF